MLKNRTLAPRSVHTSTKKFLYVHKKMATSKSPSSQFLIILNINPKILNFNPYISSNTILNISGLSGVPKCEKCLYCAYWNKFIAHMNILWACGNVGTLKSDHMNVVCSHRNVYIGMWEQCMETWEQHIKTWELKVMAFILIPIYFTYNGIVYL